MPTSPYQGISESAWPKITKKLVESFPLSMKEIVSVTLYAWDGIFESTIGFEKYRIGADILPTPQIMGFLLHELIPLELSKKYPGDWQKDKTGKEKDLVCLKDERFSIEIKTSSDPKGIFGNRSYSQKTLAVKKPKSGYYLAVNFEKFKSSSAKPNITLIRFGWLDHEDWIGQTAATGQQARLLPVVLEGKLVTLFKK